MYRSIKKTSAFILVLAILALVAIPTKATCIESNPISENRDPVAPASVIFPDIYDGPGGVQYTKIFEFSTSNWSGLKLSSSLGLSFVPSNYISKGAVAIHLIGTITQSQEQEIEIGLAKLDYWGDYPAVRKFYVSSGVYFDKEIDLVNDLDYSRTYYAYMENNYPGTITGNLGVYYSLQ